MFEFTAVIVCHRNKLTLIKKNVAGKLPLSLNPVSYTHLDVYKRQIQDCMQKLM